MSFLKKGLGDAKPDDLMKQGKDAVKDTANQCVEEGQKVVQEVVDKGSKAAKDAGDKVVGQVKGQLPGGMKKK
ncbi:hypothetical protein FKM82_015294 [Ascaphus truei]